MKWCNLDSEAELPHLLLIVERCQQPSDTESQRHSSSSLCFNDPRDCRAQKEDAISQGELSAVVLVLLDQIPWQYGEFGNI